MPLNILTINQNNEENTTMSIGNSAYNMSLKKKGLGQVSFDYTKQSKETAYCYAEPTVLLTDNRSEMALGQNKPKA